MKKFIGISFFLFSVLFIHAQNIHAPFDTLLKKYVSPSGKVNYKAFKQDHQVLKDYLKTLADKKPSAKASRNAQMAYWINLYNAATIDLILNNYPIKSIINLDGGKTWDVKRVQVGNKKVSLNYIENDLLRPTYKDARIHFAVNCAAKSCPPLLNEAWTAKNINGYFEQQAKAFINDPKYNKISPKEVQISKIFEWYAGDFGNIIDYLNKYSTTKINPNAKVSYLEYNWQLNQ